MRTVSLGSGNTGSAGLWHGVLGPCDKTAQLDARLVLLPGAGSEHRTGVPGVVAGAGWW